MADVIIANACRLSRLGILFRLGETKAHVYIIADGTTVMSAVTAMARTKSGDCSSECRWHLWRRFGHPRLHEVR